MAGEVREVNWRSAHIEARGGAIQVVPNSTLNKETIVNFSRPMPNRMELVDVAFSFQDPPYKVRQALVELLLQTDGVLKSPKPIAATLGYGDFSVKYHALPRAHGAAAPAGAPIHDSEARGRRPAGPVPAAPCDPS